MFSPPYEKELQEVQEEQIKILEVLEEVDKKIEVFEGDQQTLPAQLNVMKQALKEEEEKEADQLAVISELEAPKKAIEVEVATDREHVTKMSQQLNSMKTNEAYQAALKEISNFRKTIEEKENTILSILEQVEEANKTLQARQKVIEEHRTALETKQQEADKKLGQIDKELDILKEEREKLLSKLDSPLSRKYQFIRSRIHGSAVAKIQRGACQACHMNIPPQLLNQLQRGEEIFTCPSCKRIIVLVNETENEAMAVHQ